MCIRDRAINERITNHNNGLHCSSEGNLPNANKERFEFITLQLALKKIQFKANNNDEIIIDIKKVFKRKENGLNKSLVLISFKKSILRFLILMAIKYLFS